MKQETTLRRIATKVGLDPVLFLEMMAGIQPFPGRCLQWTGTTTTAGLVRCRYTYIIRKPYPIVCRQYVHRYLLGILYEDPPPAKLMCGNTLCINPDHWLLLDPPAPPPPPPPPELPWTKEDAEPMVDRYLFFHGWPLNPDHDLLIDIPPHILAQFQPNAR